MGWGRDLAAGGRDGHDGILRRELLEGVAEGHHGVLLPLRLELFLKLVQHLQSTGRAGRQVTDHTPSLPAPSTFAGQLSSSHWSRITRGRGREGTTQREHALTLWTPSLFLYF